MYVCLFRIIFFIGLAFFADFANLFLLTRMVDGTDGTGADWERVRRDLWREMGVWRPGLLLQAVAMEKPGLVEGNVAMID